MRFWLSQGHVHACPGAVRDAGVLLPWWQLYNVVVPLWSCSFGMAVFRLMSPTRHLLIPMLITQHLVLQGFTFGASFTYPCISCSRCWHSSTKQAFMALYCRWFGAAVTFAEEPSSAAACWRALTVEDSRAADPRIGLRAQTGQN